ncbi:3-deoxy-D-manno-octulosonic acid transferase [Pedobacter alluvionis]|uniref:3-deoxy-D-manno-octulosonic acid transferase n=1 Tax=Pedobacter alluvionis TaxID=475253 RepID=A0A497XUL3_9SPHI|nr:glycosyltransferase N-terminal domain-containing protein [Pedobacter alluvionis]RLJ72164.1 3-deoxy-D-manno-octulosonic-acid transferase [Pedobacter alluvionis]TFB28931.1 3-deoxy-D-manno-octulosonic acid transferase [Pedobacter alluvionis]
MKLLYIIGIRAYTLLIRIFSLFNPKAKLFINGRKNIFTIIARKINPAEKHIWFHFASLGEFEQGRPVLEKIKTLYPAKKIIVTFFSPSGYEIRKNYALADVFYLPIDTATNAKLFIASINPEMAIFTKYEFWHFYFQELKDQGIPLYVISGIFREGQAFFKWYGGFYRNILKSVTYFFVQNKESENLLKSIGLNNVTINGDTRFDRVYESAQSPKSLPLIEGFIGNSPTLVCGSTWPEDEKILSVLPEKYPNWKFIIAPHEIHESHIKSIEKQFSVNSVRFSVFSSSNQTPNTEHQTLIVDNIGMLSSLYQYGKVAYIGGGFGTGIHNTLEAAAFCLPVIFGPKYDKFQEAKDLIAIGAAKSISSTTDLINAFEGFVENQDAADQAKRYVANKKGATDQIISMITKSDRT